MSMLVVFFEKERHDPYIHADMLDCIQEFVIAEKVNFKDVICRTFSIWDLANVVIYSTSHKKNLLLEKIIRELETHLKDKVHERNLATHFGIISVHLNGKFKERINSELIDKNFYIRVDTI